MKIKTAIDINNNNLIATDGKIGFDSKGHLIERIDDIAAITWQLVK